MNKFSCLVEQFDDGIAIHGDSSSIEVIDYVKNVVSSVGLIVCDPPYGNIVSEKWDHVSDSDDVFSDWMAQWTNDWSDACLSIGGAFYVWGGIGRPGFRPFIRYLPKVERVGQFELSNLITWKKRRGYGTKNNYLFVREECAFFIRGDAKKPRCFNIPLLAEKRGYAGYNVKYPAKSEFYRRTNVWTDITEMMRNKLHPTQKHQRLCEVMIEVHTNKGEWVIDPFAGAGTTATACRKLGRKFVVIENDLTYFNEMVLRLRTSKVDNEKT